MVRSLCCSVCSCHLCIVRPFDFAVHDQNKNGKKELVLLTGIGSVKSEPKYTTMVPDEDLLLVSGGATP